MKFRLVHISPDGIEQSASAPVRTVSEAAAYAAASLRDTGRAHEALAQRFASRLANMHVGHTLTHRTSGYAARIEAADPIKMPTPSSLRITKPKKHTSEGSELERWEVRTGGPHSLRTIYRRWLTHGTHWVTKNPVMFDDGSVLTDGGPEQHAAGDLSAWTLRGDGRLRVSPLLVPERPLPHNAPTDRLLLP